MKRMCKGCARPLKPQFVIRAGKPTEVSICKSPVCKKYGQAQ